MAPPETPTPRPHRFLAKHTVTGSLERCEAQVHAGPGKDHDHGMVSATTEQSTTRPGARPRFHVGSAQPPAAHGRQDTVGSDIAANDGNRSTIPRKRRWLGGRSDVVEGDGVQRASTPHFHPTSLSREAVERARPVFLKDAAPADDLHDPLPEAFSPRRRKAPFVPGGMASQLQSWVVDVSSAAVADRQSDWITDERGDMTVRVEQVEGTDVMAIEGHDGAGTAVWAVLAEKAGPDARSPVPGQLVSIRQPTWTVHLRGKAHTVAIDWSIE